MRSKPPQSGQAILDFPDVGDVNSLIIPCKNILVQFFCQFWPTIGWVMTGQLTMGSIHSQMHK